MYGALRACSRVTGCVCNSRLRPSAESYRGPSRAYVRWRATTRRATVGMPMTAKEKLRETVEELTETEAAAALDYIASYRNGGNEALGDLLGNAPVDDEPTTPEEEEGLRDAREQIARGEVISAEDIRREFA